MTTAVRMSLDWKPQIEAATKIDMKKVKIRNRGSACLLKKSVQQAITMLTAIRLTEVITMVTGLRKIDWNVLLL